MSYDANHDASTAVHHDHAPPLSWVGLAMTAAVALMIPVAVVLIVHPALVAVASLVVTGLVVTVGRAD